MDDILHAIDIVLSQAFFETPHPVDTMLLSHTGRRKSLLKLAALDTIASSLEDDSHIFLLHSTNTSISQTTSSTGHSISTPFFDQLQLGKWLYSALGRLLTLARTKVEEQTIRHLAVVCHDRFLALQLEQIDSASQLFVRHDNSGVIKIWS
ncbi:unnamed protein product [Protopolystoma xenopodis]|uniref:Uncharacterized protein n=1 Tax=Protopolystoma xenopodis TaxID=117903 RepID=A0A448WSA6_9PLAT|nr:unnamed protein product [Protopolystoma xenopodis]